MQKCRLCTGIIIRIDPDNKLNRKLLSSFGHGTCESIVRYKRHIRNPFTTLYTTKAKELNYLQIIT
jgi:hypothetical protein